MTITFKIEEPGENASEIAVETRNALSAMINELQDQCAAPVAKELSADCRTDYKTCGKQEFQSQVSNLGPAPTLGGLLKSYSRSVYLLLSDLDSDSTNDDVRQATYYMEGAVNAYSRAVASLRASGVEPDAVHERMCMLSMFAPAATSSRQDDELGLYIGATMLGYYAGQAYSLMARVDGNWFMNTVTGWANADPYPNTVGYHAAPILYYEPDGPWVAGFLNVRDMGRMRFTRQRLGAWLKASGTMTDTQIRAHVEKSAQEVATASFVFLPNDYCWSGAYVEGEEGSGDVGSCMSHSTDTYETWDDIHPTEAYSAAFHGCGDNGLALVLAVDSDDEIIGRGIMNTTQGKNIVRWYGSNTAERALKKLGFDTTDSYALKESWLALLTSDAIDEDVGSVRFVHPYVDGSVPYGKIDYETRRVYLQTNSSGHRDLQMTEGSGWADPVVWCADIQEYRIEERAQRRPRTGGWQSLNPDWLCPVVHESVQAGCRHWLVLDGERVQVCEDVWYNKRSYLTQVPATAELVEEHGVMAEFWTRNPTETRRHNEWLLSQPNPEQQELALLPVPVLPSPASLPVCSSFDVPTAAQVSSAPQPSLSSASPAPDTLLTQTDTATFRLWLAEHAQRELSYEENYLVCPCQACQNYEQHRRPGLIASFLEHRMIQTACYGGTVTGRIAMSNPNLQELPRRRPVPMQPIDWNVVDPNSAILRTELAQAMYFPEVTRAAASSQPTSIQSTATTASSSSSSLTELESLLPMVSTDVPQF